MLERGVKIHFRNLGRFFLMIFTMKTQKLPFSVKMLNKGYFLNIGRGGQISFKGEYSLFPN